MNPVKMKKMITDLQELNRILTQKAKDKKLHSEEQSRLLIEAANDLVKAQTTLKHKEYEYKELQDDKERSIREVELHMKSIHQVEVDNLIMRNQTIMQQQNTTLVNMPESFKVYANLIKKASETKHNFELPLKKQFDKHISQLEQTRVLELDKTKKQYEHWLLEKDKALGEFVEKFNSYRTKKTEQLRMVEKEIVILYEYTVIIIYL
jgi:hypothetical protein